MNCSSQQQIPQPLQGESCLHSKAKACICVAAWKAVRQRMAESAPEPAEVLSRAPGAECISGNSS